MISMKIEVFPQVYEPREDSYLMLKAVKCRKGERILDMGCGSGIIAVKAALQGANVVAVDVNKDAVKNAYYNSVLNGVRIKCLVSDLFSGLKNSKKFQKIFFNPPYLAEEPNDVYSRSWAGGKNMEIILRFLEEVKSFLSENGKCYIIVSTAGKEKRVLEKIKDAGYEFNIIGKEKFFFEEIKLVEIFKEKDI